MTKKVLMLHGLGQTGEYFASKTKFFRAELEKIGYELQFATAPNRYPVADLPSDLTTGIPSSSADVPTWIKTDTVNDTYSLPKSTIDYLHDFIIEHGPFEGFVGFSQGAAVTGYLMTDINSLLGLSLDEQPCPKFFMVFSGFRFKPAAYQSQYDNHPISIPSLHVKGELDTITGPEKVEGLFNSCTNDSKTMLTHPGGHFIPSSKSFLKKIVTWLDNLDA
ncbi:hypothetical protein KAFR_0B03310 [Kazachstania africana CBS 2517]|uniref:Serine hydrolase domain-containing protein n=1 Tax=Kazachstania africana (strain ATCC 22294 / BCRC 22015 / CBS 2517 / CECT 1963 / NBRC 1671 / NRRL Y-8276) TaxID=1071382 RepID=H2AQH8_KAZAF|nr:hypothetical protein KAFR_0B03310 [Kazachstania africana CBS 2517]CCF56628.1 hypothetical protein KAFR_0B03310 [Kazachstania africana CBS 2517]